MPARSNSHVGEIIRILDTYSVIINAGADHLKVGDKVQVYVTGEPLYDLDGKILCNYEHIKDELKVIRVEKLYSVCTKQKIVEKKISFPLSPMLEHTFTEREKLNVDLTSISPLSDYDDLIHIGDFVKLLDN